VVCDNVTKTAISYRTRHMLFSAKTALGVFLPPPPPPPPAGIRVNVYRNHNRLRRSGNGLGLETEDYEARHLILVTRNLHDLEFLMLMTLSFFVHRFFYRATLCLARYMLRQFRPSVCHTGGSVKNG